MKFISILLSATIAFQFILHGEAQSVTKEYIIRDSIIRDHLRTLFSNKRYLLEEREPVRKAIKDLFNNLQSNLPSNVRNRVEVSEQSYQSQTSSGGNTNGTNVIFLVKGDRYGKSTDVVSLIGAHYDSAINAIGVNDNGAGMAVMLEIAHALVDTLSQGICSLLNSVIVVAFDNEENGLVGSKQYMDLLISETLAKFGVTNFGGAFILDVLLNFDATPDSQSIPSGLDMLFPKEYEMIKQRMFRGDFLATIARRDDIALADILGQHWYSIVDGNFTTTSKYRQISLVIPISGSLQDLSQEQRTMIGHLLRSDHTNFWYQKNEYTQKGLKAIFLTDTSDFRGYMKECYHKACDNSSHINDDRIEFLKITAEATLRSLVTLSTGSADVQCMYSSISSDGALMTTSSVTLLAVVFRSLKYFLV